MDPLVEAAVRLGAGVLATEELPDIAAAALAQGFDSPTLCELAGLPRTQVRDARDLFMTVLEELHIPGPTESVRNEIRRMLVDLTSGRRQPAEVDRLAICRMTTWDPEMVGPRVWAALESMAGCDLEVAPGETLYGYEDFRTWLDQFDRLSTDASMTE